MLVIACPRCRQPLSIDAVVLGRHVQCPACRQVFQTAAASPAPPAVRRVVATAITPPKAVTAAPPASDPAATFAGLSRDELPPGDGRRASHRSPTKTPSALVPLMLAGTVLVLLCCGGGGAGVWFAHKKANPPLVFTPHTSTDGTCSVLFPGVATDDSRFAADGSVETNAYHCRHASKDVDFELFYRDFSLTDVDQVKAVEGEFAGRIDEVSGKRGPAESRTPVKAGTLFGTDHVYKRNGKTVAVVRELTVRGKTTGRKLLLIAAGTDTSDEDRGKFLNSYRQLKPTN